jgi:glycerophosphoryl diester phosphodiesterase
MTLKLPQIIGHRGACGYAPENTLESIRAAAELGVEWVELDVKLTKDDIPIIFHDEEVDRLTNGSGLVKDKTLAELKELDAGYHFGDSFFGVTIPTLEEAVDVLLEHNLGLNLEIKPCPGREIDTAKVALDVLSQIWDDHDRLLISSFKATCLETALEVAEDWNRGLLFEEELDENWQDMADALHVATLHINGNTVTKEQVETLLDYEKPILAYTINDPMRAQELQRWGVDGVFSDVPDIIAENILTVH